MRSALIIANTEYTDPGLAQLTAPGKDAEDFARILKDQDICAFDDVNILLNQPEYIVRGTIDEFFDQKKPDDLLVLYFSGHGVRDELGALYLAVKNTNRFRLRSTALKSDFIREAMDQSRSKRQVLILDCCNSGAFERGTKAATGVSIGTAPAFEAGYGRIILTASDSTQFAWEGDKVIGETDNSLFTHFLVEGLEGEADLDGDGHITVDELYDYAYEKVKLATPKQTPSKFSSKQQGAIVLRQNIRIEDIRPVPLPDDLITAINSSLPYIREGAVRQLEVLLNGKNLGLARSARLALERIAEEDDSRRVTQAAKQILESVHRAEQLPTPSQYEKPKTSGEDEAKHIATQQIEAQRLVHASTEEQEFKAKRKAKESALVKSDQAVEKRKAAKRIEPKPTPINLPVLAGTSVPFSSQKITSQNTDQIAQLSSWGKGTINEVIYAPHGKMMAVASSLGIYIYDENTFSQINFIETGTWVSSIAFSPDGATLISGSRDKTIRLWRVRDGTLLKTLEGHTREVDSIAFSPDGAIFASGSWDKTIRLWRVRDGTLLKTLEGHTGGVCSIAFSPDGAILASGSWDKTIRLWRVSNGTLLKTLQGYTDILNSNVSIAFSPDGATLASGSQDHTIRLWRIRDGTLLKTLEGHTLGVRSIAFSLDGAILGSGSDDKTIRLWRVSDGTLLKTLEGHTGWVPSIAFSPDGATLASASDDNTIRLWDVPNGTLLKTLEGHTDGVRSIAFSPDGAMLAAGSDDLTIRLWHVPDGTLLKTLEGDHIAFSPDGTMLAAGSQDHTIRLWRVSDGALLKTLERDPDVVERSIAFSPDGALLAAGYWDKTIRLWRVRNSTLLKTVEGLTDTVDSIAFSPNGATLAAGSSDGTISLWRVRNSTLLKTLEGHTGWVNSVAFSPDGAILASGSQDKTISLWRVSDGTLLKTLEGHTEHVNSIAFSLDGAILASGCSDYAIRLWRVSDGRLLRSLEGHTSWVSSVAFSPDGQALASGSGDGTIRLWGIKP